MKDPCRCNLVELPKIHRANFRRKGKVESQKPDQEDETTGAQINGRFPCDGLSVTGSPDSDKKERWDECKFVKGLEEKDVDR